MPLYVLSPLVIGTWALVMTALERRFPFQPRYPIFRPEFFNDFVMYTFVQSYVLGFVIAMIIRGLDGITHMSQLGLVSRWPVWLQLVFFIVTHDFWQYWFHRLQHRNRFFWRIHEAAHAPLHVDWLAGSRSHALEILIAQTAEFAPIFLLGASPDVALYKGMIDAVWGMFNHSNIDVKMGPLLWFFNGPELHRWHHDLETPRGGVNLGTKLTIWDHVFGTAYYPRQRKAGKYGLHRSDEFPHGSYLRQLVYAFRPMKPRATDEARTATRPMVMASVEPDQEGGRIATRS